MTTDAGERKDGGGLGVALVVGSAGAFGLMALFESWAEAGGSGTTTTLSLRFALAAVVLWIVALVRKERVPRGVGLWARLGMGAVLYYLEARFYFGAIDAGAPSGLVALLLYTFPGLVAIGAKVLFGEALTAARVAALVLALVGAGLTVGRVDQAPLLGVLLGIGSAVVYAAYILAGAGLARHAERQRAAGVERPVSALVTAALVTSGAAISFTVEATITGSPVPTAPLGAIGIVAIALVSTVFAITALLAGIARVGAVRAASLSIVEPLVTVVVGWLALGEAMTLTRVVGGVLILAGTVIAARAK